MSKQSFGEEFVLENLAQFAKKEEKTGENGQKAIKILGNLYELIPHSECNIDLSIQLGHVRVKSNIGQDIRCISTTLEIPVTYMGEQTDDSIFYIEESNFDLVLRTLEKCRQDDLTGTKQAIKDELTNSASKGPLMKYVGPTTFQPKNTSTTSTAAAAEEPKTTTTPGAPSSS